MRPEKSDEQGVLSGIAFGVAVTVIAHLGIGYGVFELERNAVRSYADTMQPRKRKMRYGHGPVGFERRKLELDCDSIAECHPTMEPIVVEVKIAKLGTVEQDPKKLPELQTYETPDIVEDTANLLAEVNKPKIIPFKALLAQKRRVSKRRKKNNPFFKIRPDDDPRKRPTPFDRIVGHKLGDPLGSGSEMDARDTYLARVTWELNKAFSVPSSIGLDELKTLRVRVHILRMGPDGSILRYAIRQASRNRSFDASAEAALRRFMASEGGRLRLPKPEPEVLKALNASGFLADFDGQYFRR